MADPLLTKRLHISGLTPSITPEDLECRLSSFGQVKAMDGFGARDALGDPRKFGFVTMEISPKQLAKCLNVLSGSTWKGAKIRIGEAKPDFRERLAQINSRPPRPPRPKRTRAHNYGHPISTLPLTPLSATSSASAPGWVVTPSGRVVRPMRMRPERPLEPMRGETGAPMVKGVNGKVKKRVKPPPMRARRRLIDPTKWDSVYLKGVFLDAVPIPSPASKDILDPPRLLKRDNVDEEETDDNGIESDASTPIPLVQDRARPTLRAQQLPEATVATSSRTHEATEFVDVRSEANAALALLDKIFGDKEHWDGRESVDEIEDSEDHETHVKYNIEIDPQYFGEGERSKPKKDRGKGKEKSEGDGIRFGHEDEVHVEAALDKDIEMEQNDSLVSIKISAQTVESAPQTNLKALFAPKEDASFSLLDHLDIDPDLDLDADILGISLPSGVSQQPILSTSQDVEAPTTRSVTKARSRVTLDSSLPLLFPLPGSLPHPYTSPSSTTAAKHQHGAPCFLFPFTTRARGLHQLPSSIVFTRSPQETSEFIRERWEKDKYSLTREWKKAWREARGSRRGRIGAGGETGGTY